MERPDWRGIISIIVGQVGRFQAIDIDYVARVVAVACRAEEQPRPIRRPGRRAVNALVNGHLRYINYSIQNSRDR